MFDLLIFVLADYRCPHCSHSLRFRWVKRRDVPRTPWKGGVIATFCDVCPVCSGWIKCDWHPALRDDWIWAKRLAPGILVWIVAMILDFQPVLMMTGTLFLLIGFATIVYFMIAERWRRPYYVAFDPDVPTV